MAPTTAAEQEDCLRRIRRSKSLVHRAVALEPLDGIRPGDGDDEMTVRYEIKRSFQDLRGVAAPVVQIWRVERRRGFLGIVREKRTLVGAIPDNARDSKALARKIADFAEKSEDRGKVNFIGFNWQEAALQDEVNKAFAAGKRYGRETGRGEGYSKGRQEGFTDAMERARQFALHNRMAGPDQ